MVPKKVIVLGCGVAALACLAGVAAIVLFFVYMLQDVESVSVSVNGPTDVVVGQTFELNVTVINERPRDVLAVSDIDIAEDYLAGFTVLAVKPKPKSRKHVPVDNSRSFTFRAQIPPETSETFVFTLRAERPGLYRGDVDVCEGMRFITDMAETLVKEKESKSGMPTRR
jgi:hypothetical protein